jgi:hypothetical protein
MTISQLKTTIYLLYLLDDDLRIRRRRTRNDLRSATTPIGLGESDRTTITNSSTEDDTD